MRGCLRMNFLFNRVWHQHFYFNGKQLIESTCHLKNLLWIIYAIDHTFYRFTGVITHVGCWENTRKACIILILPVSKNILMWFDSRACAYLRKHWGRDWNSHSFHSLRPLSFSYPESSGFLALPRWPKSQKTGYEIGLSQAFLSEANSSVFKTLPKLIVGLQSKTCVKLNWWRVKMWCNKDFMRLIGSIH